VGGEVILAAQVAHTDDPFFAGSAIGLGIVLGGLGGGAIGAIAFGVTHASHGNSAASFMSTTRSGPEF
jgi:hypothetical protein